MVKRRKVIVEKRFLLVSKPFSHYLDSEKLDPYIFKDYRKSSK